jgi:hypothetical protein
MPADWSWVALRNVPYHGSSFSYILVREDDVEFHIYVTREIDCTWRAELYERDISDFVRVYAEGAAVVALWRADRTAILVGNTGSETMHTTVVITDTTLLPQGGTLRLYNSERRSWEKRAVIAPADLSGIGLTIEAGGFRLLEISKQKPTRRTK